jgi:mitogen-activated protein kinase kinase
MGSGGTVHRVLHRPTGKIMAKKIIHEVQMSKEVMRELQILNQCDSGDIVTFYGYYDDGQQICIFMEFMDVGSLERVCSVSGKIAEPYLGKIALSVLRGLSYLYQELRIIHRDIKPSNILLNSLGQVKICDFGVSGKAETSQIGTFVGTGAYMSVSAISTCIWYVT